MADLRFSELVAREQQQQQTQLRKPRPQYFQGNYRSSTSGATPTAAAPISNGSVRAGRVEKSLSRGNSPRTVEGRRHTTSARPRPRMFTEGPSFLMQMSNTPVYDDAEAAPVYPQAAGQQQQRPLSWHPSTSVFPAGRAADAYSNAYSKFGGPESGGYNFTSAYSSNQASQDYVATAKATASSWAQMGPSQISTDVQMAQVPQHSVMYIPSHDGSVIPCGPNWAHEGNVAAAALSAKQASTGHFNSLPSSLSIREFQYPTFSSNLTKSDEVDVVAGGAARASANLLPRTVPRIDTEHLGDGSFEEAWADEENDSPTTPGDGDVLIGMGLYDRPSDSSSLFSPFDQHGQDQDQSHYSGLSSPSACGKGLKLEEEWQPPPAAENADDLEDDDGNDEVEKADDDNDDDERQNDVAPESTLKGDDIDGEGDEDYDDDLTNNAQVYYSHATSPAEGSLKYSDLTCARGELGPENIALFPSGQIQQQQQHHHHHHYYRYESYKQPSTTIMPYGYNVVNHSCPPVVYVAQSADEMQRHEQEHGRAFYYGSEPWEAASSFAW